MLDSLRIRNFKGWADTGKIRLAPITLFFGANSSGKSSIGQFLMMLKQTVESQDRKAVFFPGDNNTPVRLGSYHEMVHKRDAERPIEFSYDWRLREPLEFQDSISNKKYKRSAISFEAKVRFNEKATPTTFVDRFEYVLSNPEAGEEEPITLEMRRKENSRKAEYEIGAEGYDLKRNQGRPGQYGAPIRFYGFPDEAAAYNQNADFLQDVNLAHERLFESFRYLGPLRSKAERFYSWSGVQPESVGEDGANFVAAILSARDRTIRIKGKGRGKKFEQVVAENLKDMGLIQEFAVKRISQQRQEYEVKVRTKGAPNPVDLPDVGFGVSQVLPVLTQYFYVPLDSVILVEQPELHLHPSAQAALADATINATRAEEKTEEGYKPRNTRFLIETHSEHFLRRLQRRVAEGEIDKTDVAAYFSDASTTPFTLYELEMDEYGAIKNWPKGFFGDEMEDVMAQSKAALKKKKAKKNAEPKPANDKTEGTDGETIA